MKEKENIWSKIKRVFAVALAPLFIALPASKAAKETKTLNEGTTVTEENTTIENTTEYEETEIIEETDGMRTAEQEEFRESIKVPTTTDSVTQNNLNNLSYNKLIKDLDKIVEERDFNKTIYKYLKEIIDNVYKNYDEWKDINKDLPTKEDYIQKNILDTLKQVNKLHFVEENSEEGKELLDSGSALGFVDEDFILTLIYNENADKDKYIETLERLLHEIGHIKQKNIIFDDNYFNNYEYIRKIIVEGRSNSKNEIFKCS